MELLLHWSWRWYPAALLVVLGIATGGLGLRRDAAGVCRPVSDPYKGWAMVRCFRTVIIGLACIGVGAAWMFQLEELLGLALIIGVGETIETTAVLAACREGSWPTRQHVAACGHVPVRSTAPVRASATLMWPRRNENGTARHVERERKHGTDLEKLALRTGGRRRTMMASVPPKHRARRRRVRDKEAHR